MPCRGGGRLDLSRDGVCWRVTATGPALAVDPALWAALDGGDRLPEITPAQVQFALLPDALSGLDRTARLDHDSDGLTLTF
ncbi:histidine phosphotransferase family protein [Roseovarius salinarum]|uniref:histidine phosphotransferase family protein n=1 Tax=Roseovarius salinarum TaxID=1981892 RepID=UPI000C31C02B|nr:histidine phosphotransferase family protein [Roseovarius salinarum]